jgi:hypothetical protein
LSSEVVWHQVYHFWTEENSMARTSYLLLLLLYNVISASAQSVGPNEAVRAPGGVLQIFSLTPEQRNAIYNTVVRLTKLKSWNGNIPPIVGAPVSPLASLGDLPESSAIDGLGDGLVKYVMVDDDVVVVDPLKMQVVDVIHGPAIP